MQWFIAWRVAFSNLNKILWKMVRILHVPKVVNTLQVCMIWEAINNPTDKCRMIKHAKDEWSIYLMKTYTIEWHEHTSTNRKLKVIHCQSKWFQRNTRIPLQENPIWVIYINNIKLNITLKYVIPLQIFHDFIRTS